jgi:hypothetical protein
MTESEIRSLIRKVLEENAALQREQLDEIANKAIGTALATFGIEETERGEVRADFIYLRQWRRSAESVKRAGWVAIITVLVSGTLGMIWLGLKMALGK